MTVSSSRLTGFVTLALSLGWPWVSCQAQDAQVISPDLIKRTAASRPKASAVPVMPLVAPWAYSPYQIYCQQPIYYGVVRVGPDHWHPITRKLHSPHQD